MNKWQMDGRTLSWPHGGGSAMDDKGHQHSSIHPYGRNSNHKAQQRQRRAKLGR